MERRVDQLDYEPRSRATRRLTLEVGENSCLLIFPLTPTWVSVVSISSIFAPAFFIFISCGRLAWMFASWAWPTAMWLVLLMMSGEAALYGAIGLFQLRSFYRYGHIPRVIRVDRTREALSTHREGSNRWRDWPLAAVREVQLKPLKSVIPGQKANELVIRVQGRWIPLRYRIRNQDVPVAERFVTWLNDSRL